MHTEEFFTPIGSGWSPAGNVRLFNQSIAPLGSGALACRVCCCGSCPARPKHLAPLAEGNAEVLGGHRAGGQAPAAPRRTASVSLGPSHASRRADVASSGIDRAVLERR